MKLANPRRWALRLTAMVLAAAPTAFAQGCVMCYTSAAQAGKGAHAFDRAILVLLVPVLLLFTGVLGFAYRRFKMTENVPQGPEGARVWRNSLLHPGATPPRSSAGWTGEMR